MKQILLLLLISVLSAIEARAEPEVAIEEQFDQELSKDWFWGLGIWTVKDGVLKGFEAGPRRHGPVKMRRLALQDGIVECEFKLEGKATFAGIIFNGSQERGYIVHLVMGKDALRILAHPKKGESVELIQEARSLEIGVWHRARVEFKGSTLTARVDDHILQTSSPAIAEEKLAFGLGGDSGGPEGEKVGTLEFRHLKITKN